ncbi:MAG: sodium:solute symporter family protein [Fusobacteriaceae bacterium]
MNIFILYIYFLIVLVIGAISFKKSKNSLSFFLANKDAGVLQVTGTLLATVLGSTAILGSVAFSYSNGWAGAWFMLCAAFGLSLLYFFIPKFRNFKGYNLPQLLESFYGEEVKILSSIIIPIAWVGIVAAQIIGSAQIINIFAEMSYTSAVILSGTVFIIYTILGGQLSIIKTDFLQLIVIVLGILFTYFSIRIMSVNYEAPELINESFTKLDLFIMVMTYSSTFLVGPDIYSRIFCAKNEEVAKKSIILAVAFLIPLAFILASIGIHVSHLAPELDTVVNSPLLYLASTELSKPVSLLLYFGLLSAVISTADTSLMSGASIFAQIFTKNLESEKSIKITRIFIGVFGFFSILVALKLKFILTSLLLALSVFAGAFIFPTLAGLLGYRGKKEFTILAMILGGVIALLGKIYGNNSLTSIFNSNYIIIFAFLVNATILFLPKIIYKKIKIGETK